MRETKSNKKISLKQVKNCALVEQESERCVCMYVWGRLNLPSVRLILNYIILLSPPSRPLPHRLEIKDRKRSELR